MPNAHLRGKIELAKIGERSEQNSQLYFVPLEVLVICTLLSNLNEPTDLVLQSALETQGNK